MKGDRTTAAINNTILSRRHKILDCQRENIPKLKERGAKQADLARQYGVDEKTIRNILRPEQVQKAVARAKENGTAKKTYNRFLKTLDQNKYRAYKRELFKDIPTEKLTKK